jgi:excisionase family DNA binding protein
MSEKMMRVVVENTGDKNDRAGRSSQLLTPEQCAAFLQIEVNTLYVMKSQGRIPYRKVGHLLRFDFEEIVEWTKPKGKGL